MRFSTGSLLALLVIAGCASDRPEPNSAIAKFDQRANAVQLTVSDFKPVSSAELVGPDGARYAASGINVIDAPHTSYNPPPTVGFGLGGFTGNIGTGLGLGLPLGGPTPGSSTDQYVTSALIPVPADYAQNWRSYMARLQVGDRVIAVPAPPPR